MFVRQSMCLSVCVCLSVSINRVDDTQESGGVTGTSSGDTRQSDDDRLRRQGEMFAAVDHTNEPAADAPHSLTVAIHLLTYCLFIYLSTVLISLFYWYNKR